MLFHMRLQTTRLRTRVLALSTLVGLFTCVHSYMFLQIVRVCAGVLALSAMELHWTYIKIAMGLHWTCTRVRMGLYWNCIRFAMGLDWTFI